MRLAARPAAWIVWGVVVFFFVNLFGLILSVIVTSGPTSIAAFTIGSAGSRENILKLQSCLAIEPEAAICHYNRALTYAALGRAEAAQRGYSRAIELDPGLAAARLNRGILSYKAGRHPEAIADFAGGLEAGPDRETRGRLPGFQPGRRPARRASTARPLKTPRRRCGSGAGTRSPPRRAALRPGRGRRRRNLAGARRGRSRRGGAQPDRLGEGPVGGDVPGLEPHPRAARSGRAGCAASSSPKALGVRQVDPLAIDLARRRPRRPRRTAAGTSTRGRPPGPARPSPADVERLPARLAADGELGDQDLARGDEEAAPAQGVEHRLPAVVEARQRGRAAGS